MENAARDVTSEPALAHDVDGLPFFEFADAFAELVDWDIHEPFDVSERVFSRRSRVEQGDGAVARKIGELGDSPLFDDASRDVVPPYSRGLSRKSRGARRRGRDP